MMNFGICIKQNTGAELGPEYLDFYKQSGIGHIEISIRDCSEGSVYYSAGFKNHIAGLSRDFSISFHSVMWTNYIHPAKRTRREAYKALERMLELCDETGVQWLTLHIGHIIGLKRYLGSKLDRFARELNALYDRRNFMTPVCIENMPVLAGQRLSGECFSELERVLAQVDASRCGLLVDTGHYFLMQDRHIGDSATLSRTLGVHVHNNGGKSDDHQYIYDGVHDPAQLLRDVLAAAPDARLMLENYEIDLGAVKKSLAYLRGVLG